MIEPPETAPQRSASVSHPRPRAPWWRKRRKGLLRAIGSVFAHTLAPATLWLYSRTWRYVRLDAERRDRAREGGSGVILALWHGRMLLAIPPYRGEDMTILVSGSEDGDLSEALLEGWGYRIIRGSTSKGGARALRSMLTALRAGSTVVVTPDGPRGPRHSMNPGVAWMARATGHAVLPAGFATDRAWHLASWDRYTIPKPFARVVLAYGEPVRVERDASAEELERATRRIRDELLRAEEAAFARLGRKSDH